MRLAIRPPLLPALALAAVLLTPWPASSQEPLPGLRLEGSPASPSPGPSRIIGSQTTIEDGNVCTTIDFEGVGDQRPIPEFDGIQSPDWLGIIDADAGGNGNFANEPSPSTIAFWLGGTTGTGSSRDVVFAEPAAIVDLFYASAVTTRMEAFDASGNRVATATGPANLNRGPGGDPTGAYNRWDPLRLEVNDNRIARIRVFGAINQTGIDDLKVCRRSGVDTVELTQAIQELQDLDALKADLARDGEPPVPIVRGKPAVMRVYPREVQARTELRFVAEIGGQRRVQTVTVIPGCTRERMRLQDGCPSADFPFTPTAAQVPIELVVQDAAGREIERHQLRLRTRRAEPLVLSAVKVCDGQNAQGVWQCAENYRARLAVLSRLLRSIAPTHSVQVTDSGETVRMAIDADGDGTVTTGRNGEESRWWFGTAKEIDDLAGFSEGLDDFLGREDRRFYGIARGALPGSILGIAADIPSRGALSRSSARDLGVDVSEDTVAHEVFHALGRRHTNTSTPSGSTAPGCGFARDSTTDWPYRDNRLRSGPRSSSSLEVGFDVARRRALSGDTTFDVMSYCAPVWVSPHTYTRLLDQALGRSATARSEPKAMVRGRFWRVAGGAVPGGLELEPIFELETVGENGRGDGTFRIEVRRADGSVLFTRRFTPQVPHVRVPSGQDEPQGGAYFSELVPVQEGAARVVVLDPSGQVLLSTRLQGAAPAVTLTAPAGGGTVRGMQEIRWQVSDPDSQRHQFWVRYSPDRGALGSWRTLGFVEGTRLQVDFDDLPGSSGRALIQVLASDGVNTGAATSAAFSVPTGGPEVAITFPEPGAIFQRSQAIWLQAAAFDDEDGALEGGALRWSSDRDGALGEGESLTVDGLSVGAHTLTLTARDSDGNTARREVRVTVAGAGPQLDLQVEALDTLPTTCVQVTLGARPGSVDLQRAEYSLDGGDRWTAVPLSRLPYRFIVPGSGFFHLVTRVTDRAGQIAADDARFFTDSVCRDATPPPPAGPWLSSRRLPGFRFKAQLTSGQVITRARSEDDCIGETLCLSGQVPGRSELFTRIIGPRPNGKLWVNLVRFTPSEVELWVEQTRAGVVNYYRLGELAPGESALTGVVDKEAFDPEGRRRSGTAQARSVGMPGVEALTPQALTGWLGAEGLDRVTAGELRSSLAEEVVFRSPEIPGFRFTVRIFSGGEVEARREGDCLPETVCVSGALPGRSEVFVRLIGPRPNGFLWVNLVRFTTSRVEVEIEQDGTGQVRRYVLPAIDRESDALDGLVDTTAFRP